jgi:hypothetical protein
MRHQNPGKNRVMLPKKMFPKKCFKKFFSNIPEKLKSLFEKIPKTGILVFLVRGGEKPPTQKKPYPEQRIFFKTFKLVWVRQI